MSDIDRSADLEAINDVVERFYAAFEEGDFDAMSDIWAHDDASICTHPGWARLNGWAAISASWFGVFEQTPPLQVIVTNQQVHLNGDVAWVSLDENLLGVRGDGTGTTVSSLKVLRRVGPGWRIVAHHGSVVERRIDVLDALDPFENPEGTE